MKWSILLEIIWVCMVLVGLLKTLAIRSSWFSEHKKGVSEWPISLWSTAELCTLGFCRSTSWRRTEELRFNALKSFSVCQPALTPCLGHDIFEGVLSYCVGLDLKYLIKKKDGVRIQRWTEGSGSLSPGHWVRLWCSHKTMCCQLRGSSFQVKPSGTGIS